MRATEQLPDAEDEEDCFDVANLPPEVTGLPMVAWVWQRGRSHHYARVKVSLVHRRRMNIDQTSSVRIYTNELLARLAPLDG